MSYKPQRIRDPVHNLIEFEAIQFEDALWRVIQTRPFQRLRRIKQLGFSDFVYPGATHSRFAHSLGVFHTSRKLMTVVERHLGSKNFEQTSSHHALAAALVHDLGHGPFSHAFEEVGRRLDLKMAHHEHVSNLLVRDGEVSEALNTLGSGFANDVANVISSAGPGNIYSAVVSSQFDADRLDYMRRDSLMTGTQHGAIDFEWLIANLEVGSIPSGVDDRQVADVETFVLGPKAIHAAEAYVLGLFQLYPAVYLHKATRSAEKMMTELLVKVISETKQNGSGATGLSDRHPVIQFAKDSENIERILQLDDTVVWGALSMMADASDKLIAEFSRRIRDRKLFKCIDVRARLASLAGDADRACASISGKIEQWTSENANGDPRILVDQASREPYKRFEESKGPLNQIRIRTTDNKLVDLGEKSKVVAAIEPFKLFRVYLSEDDSEARTFVEQEVRNATGS